MEYQKACEVMGVSDPANIRANAEFGKSYVENPIPGRPLRFSVAAQVLIDACPEVKATIGTIWMHDK